MTELTDNVVLQVLPTTQFKTIQVVVDFATPLTQQNVHARSLLSYLQAVSSAQYADQQGIAGALIALYGAQFETDVLRIGNTHHVRFSLQIPAPQYVGANATLLTGALTFLRDMIFAPRLAADGLVDAGIFAQERQSLQHDLASLADDKRRYAVQQLKTYTYSKEVLSWSASGTQTGVAAVTREAVTQAWRDMLAFDAVQILVNGDVDQNEITEQIKTWPLAARRSQNLAPFYRQGLRPTTVEMSETQADLQQAVLTLAYHVDLDPASDERFVALVFNSLFGGSALSLLFTNVREAASLAYAVSSKYEHDTGFMRVVAGLDATQVEAADALIQAQLTLVRNGEFSETLLESIKNGLINDYLSQQDSPNAQVEQAFMRTLTQRTTPLETWVAMVQNVSREAVANLAQRVILQTKFVLNPQNAENK